MPPSPAMRCSLGREPRANNHKRGRSLEGGVPLKQRDDDLALFKEVQSRERDNFLLQGNDDFEDIFANKLQQFSDYKLGINVPARGESSDLLHAEEEKNDYEWLLTPPDTPLFRSLDDEAPQVNLAQRGRTRTQPIAITRSSTMEKSHRSSRGSASPNRVSLSPQSHNNTFESRGRASSAPSASPPTILKPTTASLRSSPPSHKPSTAAPHASTPTPLRRLSTGSISTTSSKGSRGNSPSPKVKAWQSTIPGFSTEVPPNLRTSLADRPASYVRGSSPASINSRQSMSPTASRSISSSYSKGSFGSSGDDDVESFSSVLVGSRQRLNSRRVGGFQNNKKPSRTVSSSSAPKRSFDLALRQMDHKRGPQNMFRPLLSSVPSSTFRVGISMNSSVMTSSNVSSGIEIIGAHNREVSHDDATSGYVKMQDAVDDDEVFVVEKDDALNNGTHNTVLDSATFLICAKCGCEYTLIGPVETHTNVCEDCIELYSPLTIVDQVGVAVVQARAGQHNDLGKEGHFLSEDCDAKEVNLEIVDFSNSKVETLEGGDSPLTVVDQVGVAEVNAQSSQHNDLVKNGLSVSESFLFRSQSEKCEGKKVNHELVDFSKSKVETLGAGISILLKRSSSIKGAVVRNTNFSASSISYDDLSYVRDSTISMRSVSASSSVDFGVNKQMDNTRFQRQTSSTKSEIENYKYDLNAKHKRRGSSFDSSEKHGQENNEMSDTFIENDKVSKFQTTLIQTHDEEAAAFQIAEGVGPGGTSALQASTIEKDSTDVAEAPLDAISEGEYNQTGQSSTASKCGGSRSSTSSKEGLQEDAVTDKDHDTYNPTSNNTEELVVLVEHNRGLKGRSLTLEEATDTILFCSSIVHNLAHNAATIAIEKENSLDSSDDNGSWPLIPATRKSDLNKPDLESQSTTKQTSKSQRTKQRKEAEINPTKALNTPKTLNKPGTDQPKTRIVGVRDLNNGESKKPPMLESKCNCTIM